MFQTIRKRLKPFGFTRQFDQMDCGPACSRMVARYHGKDYPLSYLSGLYQTINAALTQPLPSVNAAPQITAPVQSSSDYQPTPESSGIKKGSSSGRNEDSSAETDTDDAKASEEETAEEQEGAASDVPRTDPSGDSQVLDTAQVSQVQENRSPVTIIVLIASAALLVLVAALVAILLTMKKR